MRKTLAIAALAVVTIASSMIATTGQPTPSSALGTRGSSAPPS